LVADLHTYLKGIKFDALNLNDKKAYVFLWFAKRKSTIDSTVANGFILADAMIKWPVEQSKLANILHAKELSRRLKV
jgi:hypothetical protein